MRIRHGILMIILVMLATTASTQGAWPDAPTTFELTLDSAITRALTISPSLELAQLEAEKARLEQRVTERATEDLGDVSSYQVAVVKYLYPEQRRLAVQLADWRVEGVQANIALQVRTAYLGKLLSREMLSVTQEAVSAAKEQVRLTQRLYESGMVPRKDVMDASVRHSEAQASLLRAEKDLALAMMGLARVIGLPLDAQIQLEPGVPLLEVAGTSLPEQIEKGLKHRFELRQRLNAIKLARLNHSLAEEYPATMSWQDWMDEWPEEVPVPPWLPWEDEDVEEDDELNEINRREAEIEYQQAIIYYLLTKDEIQMQIRDATLQIEEASQRLMVSEQGLKAAEEGLRLARLRYQAGVGTNLETISAELARSQAQTALVAALFEHELAKAAYLHRASAGFVGSEDASLRMGR